MSWLFELEDVLLPSVYLRLSLSNADRVGLVGGRVKEALRIARQSTPRKKILPYYWYKYQDHRDTYLNKVSPPSSFRKHPPGIRTMRHLISAEANPCWSSKRIISSQADLEATLRKISDLGADGLIIWGSSNDVNTNDRCLQFREYLNNELGPAVRRVRQTALGFNHYAASLADNQTNVSVDQV